MNIENIKRSILTFNTEQWLFDDYDSDTVISPLTHTENSKIVVFIVLMLGLVFTIPILLIIMYGHFMAKKNNDFGYIEESRRNIARFFNLIILIIALGAIGFVVVVVGEDIMNRIQWGDYSRPPSIKWYLVFLIPLIVPTTVVALFLRYLIDISYFNIIKRHSTWVVNKGIFSTHNSDRKQKNSGEIKNNTCNIADELQKLSKLKDKGVIDSEELTKLKEKLLQYDD